MTFFLKCIIFQSINFFIKFTEGRTFAHHFLRRMSFAIVPAAFVVGVITTLLAALTIVSMKSVGIGSILLVLALGQFIARSFPTSQSYQAPLPLVYAHSRSEPSPPVWVEKDWS